MFSNYLNHYGNLTMTLTMTLIGDLSIFNLGDLLKSP